MRPNTAKPSCSSTSSGDLNVSSRISNRAIAIPAQTTYEKPRQEVLSENWFDWTARKPAHDRRSPYYSYPLHRQHLHPCIAEATRHTGYCWCQPHASRCCIVFPCFVYPKRPVLFHPSSLSAALLAAVQLHSRPQRFLDDIGRRVYFCSDLINLRLKPLHIGICWLKRRHFV